jgi:hypothetical protein
MVLILINLSLIFWMKAGWSERKVMVEVDQEVVGVYDLDSSPGQVVRATGPLGISEIEIREGRARMLSSPCPEQTCVKTGWIDSQGQIICCVPNKIIIWISGCEKQSPDQFDGITR